MRAAAQHVQSCVLTLWHGDAQAEPLLDYDTSRSPPNCTQHPLVPYGDHPAVIGPDTCVPLPAATPVPHASLPCPSHCMLASPARRCCPACPMGSLVSPTHRPAGCSLLTAPCLLPHLLQGDDLLVHSQGLIQPSDLPLPRRVLQHGGDLRPGEAQLHHHYRCGAGRAGRGGQSAGVAGACNEWITR